MPRWAQYSGLLLLVFSLGCASLGQDAPAWKNRGLGFAKSQQKKEAEDQQRHPPQQEEPRRYEPLIAKVLPSQWKPSADAPKLDPEELQQMQELVQTDLRNASLEERKEWLKAVHSLDSHYIPEVIKGQKIYDKELEKHRVAAAPSSKIHNELNSPSAERTIQPAGHALRSDDESTADLFSARNFDDESTNDFDSLPAPDRQLVKTESSPQLETPPADVASNTGWSRKILGVAEPSWFKGAFAGEESQASAPAARDKEERSIFGLPQMLGGGARNEPVPPTSSGQQQEPQQSAALDTVASPPLHVAPGAEMWEDEMQKLIALLESGSASAGDSAAARDQLKQQITLRMLYLISGESQRAQQTIPGLPAADQEFWSAMLAGLAEHLDEQQIIDPSERAAQTMAHLRSAAHHLSEKAQLQVRNVVFCERIHGFGNYETYEANEFRPGQTVLVYAEMRNFESQPTLDGFYRTLIRSTVEISRPGSDNTIIDRNSFEATEDLCRSLRSDYFHSYRITLPAYLASGAYLLKMTVHDELSGKSTSETIRFVVP